MKVLITDPISEEGIEELRQRAEVDVKIGLKEDEIVATIGDYEALMVRSFPCLWRQGAAVPSGRAQCCSRYFVP